MTEPTKKVELCKHQAIHCSQCSTLPKEPEGLIDFEFCERFSDELDAINYFAIKSKIQDLLAQQATETRLATIEEIIQTLPDEKKCECKKYDYGCLDCQIGVLELKEKLKSLKEQTN